MAESQKDALVRMIKKRRSGRKPSGSLQEPEAAVRQQASADAQAYYARHKVVVEAAGTHSPCLKLEAAPFPAPLLKLLQAQFETPTPIQAACWPLAATACRDVLAIARTGSGKTLAFLLPAISRLTGDVAGPPQCLVLVPTRELALQHTRVATVFCAAISRRAVAVYGGAPRQAQAADLRAGADLVVATPGRLLDLLDLHSERASAAKGMPCKFFLKGRCGKGAACPFKHADAAGGGGGGGGGSAAESGAGASTSLARCALIVLDEADMMLALGFERFIRATVAAAPAEHQTLMLTATWPPEVERVAASLLRAGHATVSIGGGKERLTACADVAQKVHVVAPEAKWDHFLSTLARLAPRTGGTRRRLIVFANTKRLVAHIGAACAAAGHEVDVLSGDRSQAEREATVARFKAGRLSLLVATDVAARGLDVPDIDAVINYDFPLVHAQEYVHRVGRTGRAGKQGLAETFFTRDDARHAGSLATMLRDSGQPVPDALRAMAMAAAGTAGAAGAGAVEAADGHADHAAPRPQSRLSLARARARAEGTGGHKLSMPWAQGAQDADNTATDARPMSEPSEAQSSTPWPDTSSMTNKERKAYFKAARVTTLDPPRAGAEKRAKTE